MRRVREPRVPERHPVRGSQEVDQALLQCDTSRIRQKQVEAEQTKTYMH